MKPMITGRYGKRTDSKDMMGFLGLRPGSHLPAEGMPERLIQGVRVFVKPVDNPRALGYRKSSKHRVMVVCGCDRNVPFGRLRQHKCEGGE